MLNAPIGLLSEFKKYNGLGFNITSAAKELEKAGLITLTPVYDRKGRRVDTAYAVKKPQNTAYQQGVV